MEEVEEKVEEVVVVEVEEVEMIVGGEVVEEV